MHSGRKVRSRAGWADRRIQGRLFTQYEPGRRVECAVQVVASTADEYSRRPLGSANGLTKRLTLDFVASAGDQAAFEYVGTV